MKPVSWIGVVMLDLVRTRSAGAGLEQLAERILRLARPAVRLNASEVSDEKLPVGASKIGGFPDLQLSADWPRWNDRALAFLAQINLSDLQHFKCCDVLPSEGLLQFFYDEDQRTWGFDPKDRGSWCVRFEANLRGLQRSSGEKHYPTCRLETREVMTLPAWECYDFDQLGLTPDERDDYFKVLDEVESKEMMWGDAGRLYFWITKGALENLRFGESWMVLQCG